MNRPFLWFVLVGGIATTIHYVLLVVMVSMFSWPVVFSSASGFVVAAACNYGLNYSFTFRSTRPHSEAAPRFLIVALTGLALNSSLIHLGAVWLSIHYMLSQLFATGVVLFWNFWMNRAWSFSSARTACSVDL